MSISKALQKKGSSRILKLFQDEFIEDYCCPGEISDVFALGNHILARSAHINEHILSERHRKNRLIIKCIKKKGKFRNKLTGYFILYPINKECERLIEESIITKGQQIRSSHICDSFESASSLYLSMVYGEDRHTQAFIIHLLKQNLLRTVKAHDNLRNVYVRPVTCQGFRITEKYHFQKLSEDSGIFCYRINRELL